MASKRKSTTPCMIPSKRLREELEQEPPVLVRQGGAGRQSPLDLGVSSKAESGDHHGSSRDGAGTYTCRPCNFETRDLNLFLDHVYSGHPDFRADPSFLCVDCGASAAKFEGLALHNARVHPSTLNTTLQLRKRDRKVVVEQHLVGVVAGTTDRDAEISITKTPIMRMLKGKFESRRIAVPHAASDEELVHSAAGSAASRESEKKDTPPAVAVAHVPTIVHNGATTKVTLPSAIQIVNGSGALPMLKTAMTQVVSVVQNRSLQQTAPVTVSSPSLSSASSHSHASSKNLPKVMIPLSSIPTYSATMDSSSFLKTSFSKFPYPTKAELCYLTVVTKFPEEQIKIWFTAQRLKQGISWSPEEIDEARRKMFNTIIQTAPPAPNQHQRHQQQNHGHHHQQAQHTFTVLPAQLGQLGAQLGPTGIPHILQGSLVSPGGVIVTQPVTMTNGIQVSSAPVALAVTPKPQAAARPMMQARPAAALVADKGVSMVVGTVGSSSSGGSNIGGSGSRSGGSASGASSVISSSSSGSNGNSGSSISTSHASVINLSLGHSNHHGNTNGKASGVNGKPGGANAADKSNGAGGASTTKEGCEKKNAIDDKTSNTSTTSNKGNSESKVYTDVKSVTESKANDGSKKGSSSAQKSKDAVSSKSNSSTSSSTASVLASTASPRNTPTPPTASATNSPSPGLKIEAASSPAPTKSSSPSPAAAVPSSSGAPPLSSSKASLSNAFLDPSFYKGKKSQEQLAALKDSFVLNQFPNQEEVDRLISLTGLTVREVRKWFSDRRYHFRNLKGSKTAAGGEKTKSGSTAAAGGSGKGASGTASETDSSTPMDLSDGSSSSASKSAQQASGGGAKTPKQDSSAPKTPQQTAASSAPLSPPPSGTPTSPSTPSRRPPRPPSPDFTAIRYKEREPHQVRALEASFAQEADPSGEEVDRLRAETKMTRREIHGWFADKRKRAAADRKREEAERAVREEEDMMGGVGGASGAEERGEDGSSPGGPKVNPIKINLKMLKVTEANGKPEGDGSSENPAAVPPSSSPPPSSSTPKPASSSSQSPCSTPTPAAVPPKPSPSPKPSSPAVRGKKTAEQLHLLKQVYARTQWPSAPQYDQLIAGTGLARPEVVRWFGDCRYVQKNGTLKWLEEYQGLVRGEDCGKGDVAVLQAHLDANNGTLDESQLGDLAQASNLTEELVRHWFSVKTDAAAALSLDKDTTAAAADRSGSDSEAAPPASDRTASEAPPPGSSDRTGSASAAPLGSHRTGACEAAPLGSSDRTGSEEAAPLQGSTAEPQGGKGECGSSSSSSSGKPQQGEVKEESVEQSVCGGLTKEAQEQSDKAVNATKAKGTD